MSGRRRHPEKRGRAVWEIEFSTAFAFYSMEIFKAPGTRLEVSRFPVRAGSVLAKEAGTMESMVPSPVAPATTATLIFWFALLGLA